MKTICLYFQVHQPFRFKRYRFFDIGNNHYYYDDYTNESVMRKMASKSYLPTNKLLLDLFKEYGSRFKVAFSISGTALDQFSLYAPDVLESFKKLALTGCVEFLSETNSHSLVSLKNKDEFQAQVKEHDEKIFKFFNVKPSVFRNTELIYNNEIGEWLSDIGYNAAITEGAKHILGWKSPNYIYCSATNPRLKLILKNSRLSDDIAFRFSDRGWNEFPLTAEKFTNWIKTLDSKEETVNLFMNYETFGSLQTKESGIFDFLKALPKFVLSTNKLSFSFPSELIEKFQPVAPLFVPYTISWADEERDVSAWLGNELQQEAFSKLYSLRDKVIQINDEIIQTDWKYLQTSDHFYYMCTKFFIHGSMHSYYNPFNSPYDAFINYMNILSDFEIRVNEALNPKEEPVKTASVRPSRSKKPVSSRAATKVEKTQTKRIANTTKKTTAKSSTVTQKAKGTDVNTQSTRTGKSIDSIKKEKPASKKAAKAKPVSKTKEAKPTITKKVKPTPRKVSNKTAVTKSRKPTEKKKL